MEDHDIIDRIGRLVDEEHGLERRVVQGEGISEEDRSRLSALEVQLDQCWDLLRQRRALRDSGSDPEDAEVRDPNTVEGYRQ